MADEPLPFSPEYVAGSPSTQGEKSTTGVGISDPKGFSRWMDPSARLASPTKADEDFATQMDSEIPRFGVGKPRRVIVKARIIDD
jgi:hypothetical protein